MVYEKYLPVGTVVLLKDGEKKVMITGFLARTNDNQEITYDYSGCLYPEGILNSQKTLLFNHEQISKIFHLGYIDEDEKKFKEKINNYLKGKKD